MSAKVGHDQVCISKLVSSMAYPVSLTWHTVSSNPTPAPAGSESAGSQAAAAAIDGSPADLHADASGSVFDLLAAAAGAALNDDDGDEEDAEDGEGDIGASLGHMRVGASSAQPHNRGGGRGLKPSAATSSAHARARSGSQTSSSVVPRHAAGVGEAISLDLEEEDDDDAGGDYGSYSSVEFTGSDATGAAQRYRGGGAGSLGSKRPRPADGARDGDDRRRKPRVGGQAAASAAASSSFGTAVVRARPGGAALQSSSSSAGSVSGHPWPRISFGGTAPHEPELFDRITQPVSVADLLAALKSVQPVHEAIVDIWQRDQGRGGKAEAGSKARGPELVQASLPPDVYTVCVAAQQLWYAFRGAALTKEERKRTDKYRRWSDYFLRQVVAKAAASNWDLERVRREFSSVNACNKDGQF